MSIEFVEIRNPQIPKLKKADKILVLLTSEFPYGPYETFLENEMPILLKSYDEIYIVNELNEGNPRLMDDKIQIITINKFLIWVRLKVLFSKILLKEIYYLMKTRQLNRNNIRTALYTLSKAEKIKTTIQNILKPQNISVFYSYWLDERALALALLKSELPTINTISRAHGWDIYEERHLNNYLPFRNFILSKLNHVCPISNHGKNYLESKYLNDGEKIKIMRLGTLPLASKIEENANREFQILSTSMVIPLKRVEKILDVVSSIHGIKVNWTHIGDGPLLKYLDQIAELKVQLNSLFSYTFLGQKTNSEVREFLSKSYVDLFINLSETEGVPVSIMEAQSAGITVLATNVGGNSEIVNEENGFLVEKDFKLKEVTSIIQKYLSSTDEEKQQKRKASYNNWKKNYNAETNYNEFVNLINNLN